jgi:hypothetical protein
MRTTYGSLLVGLLAVASGCSSRVYLADGGVLEGDGMRGTRRMEVPTDASTLVIRGSFLSSVVLVPGGGALELEGENLFLPFFQASSDGGTVTVGFDETVGLARSGPNPLVARIPVKPALERLDVTSGLVPITGNGLKGKSLDVTLAVGVKLTLTGLDHESLSVRAGSGSEVVLSGKADQATFLLENASLQADRLQVRKVTLAVQGERRVSVTPVEPIVEVNFPAPDGGG